jgi:hypothetical protein
MKNPLSAKGRLRMLRLTLVGALAATIAAIPALAQAAPAEAQPDPRVAVDAACGTEFKSWQRTILRGNLYRGDTRWQPFGTEIYIRADQIVDWKMEDFGEAYDHDRFWIENGNRGRFRSDLGRGWGQMYEFTLYDPQCDDQGRVISAHVSAQVPAGVMMYFRTWRSLPLTRV